jgi:lipopolysaccharide transport system permease protein
MSFATFEGRVSVAARRQLTRVWLYRDFVFGSVKREFQTEYRKSLLGAAWIVISPLALILIYTIVFSQVMRSRLPSNNSQFAYSIYLCSGILAWMLFAESVERGQRIFIDNGELIKKLNFPKACLFIVLLLNSLIRFAIAFVLFLIFLLFVGQLPGIQFLAFVPLLLVQLIFTLGLCLILGTLNVFFRDVGQFTVILLQFWFWFTPIVYPSSILPDAVRSLLVLNPMADIIGGYQRIMVDRQWPDWWAMLFPVFVGVCLCGIGLYIFGRCAGDLADEV